MPGRSPSTATRSTAAVHDALAPTDPKLAAQVARVAPIDLHVKANDLPHLHDAKTAAGTVAVLAIMGALLLITAALLLQHDRRSVSRVGRRIAFLAFMPLVVFAVVPRVLQRTSGDAPQIASALLRVYADRVLPSAIVLVVVGLTVAVGALVWPRAGIEHAATSPPPRFTGPTPSPRPAPGTEHPTVTEKLYL